MQLVGADERGQALLLQFEERLALIQKAVQDQFALGKRRPRIYFEEWDEPPISGIRWVSELIGIAGGEDVFPELAAQGKLSLRLDTTGGRYIEGLDPASSYAVLERFSLRKRAIVRTGSQIPVSRGLKSSSAAAGGALRSAG